MEHDSASENETATLNKGPWNEEEDKLLVDYVQKHGEGNWNTVQKHSGLSRCGKSCRLRWVNHLRPDLKKGAFSEEEEQLVVNFHASYGSKWALMAQKLPGRTDNEIKNFWNTRVKRRKRQDLPVYPDEVLEKVKNAEEQSGQNTDLFGLNQRQEDYSKANRIENPVPYSKFLPPPKQDQSYYDLLFSRISFAGDFVKQILCLFDLSHLEQELVNYPLVDPEPLIPLDPSFNPHEVSNDWGVQESNLMQVLQSDNTSFTEPLYDETLKAMVYGSAGVRQEPHTTDSGSQYSQIEPASANTTDEVSLPPLPPSFDDRVYIEDDSMNYYFTT